MSSAVQDTIKALVEFEAELDSAKSGASDARRKLVKNADDWASASKATSLSKAQAIASSRLSKAKAEAEKEADAIRSKGASELKSFESSISRRRSKAAALVVVRLLGASD